MQAIVEMFVVAMADSLQCFARSIFTVGKPRGNIHVPMRKSYVHRFQPSVNSSFANVYLLSAADQTNDNRPIFVAIHAGNQKLRLGLVEAFPFFFAA